MIGDAVFLPVNNAFFNHSRMIRPMSDEIRIFISYAREDQPRVQELYDLLVDAGYHPWLDREHIHRGQRWEPIIKSAPELVMNECVISINRPRLWR